MASKREIKKIIKEMVYDIMDECDFHVVSMGKNAGAAEALMDEAVGYHEMMMAKIRATKDKAGFRALRVQLEEDAIGFMNKINDLA
ncbi:MAG: hypothetical protein HRT58_06435 [Crocinitomicaceae bacterium]|nr:hypothetical protein [Flavobacteriales bacterium]NQZ35282.1 hypothetical protein [Crocinitomicaceae bacterium]PHR17005.1 MAG: hypothetical protein COA38_21440 [Fluviicola sp.]